MARFFLTPLISGVLSACSTAPAADKAANAAPATSTLARVGDSAHPVVVELFQSQGYSSCPPAIANVNAIADRPDILALTFAVTYWDRLGWKDTFATPAQTKRQWDYANGAKRGQVFTPQVIINGEASIVGARRSQLDQTIAAARKLSGPAITAAGSVVTIAPGKAATPAIVWLVAYDPRAQQVRIGWGENGGRTIAHKNVVRDLVLLGSWTGKSTKFALPASKPGHRQAVLVQSGNGGAIISARAT